jgi:hypothetical protein
MADQVKPVGPAITSAHVPKAPAPVIPASVMAPKAIVAKPLNDPEFMGIIPANPMHHLYWANREHQNGVRVGYRLAQGFRLAKKDDVRNCPEFMIDPSGQIIYGDLVLMLIGKDMYQGALLHNHNKAVRRVNKFGQFETNETGKPLDVMAATLSETGAPAGQQAKIRSFVPGQGDLSSVFENASVPEKP